MSRILVQIIGSMQLAQVHASRPVRKHQNICDCSSEAMLCRVCILGDTTRLLANPEDLLNSLEFSKSGFLANF